MFNFIKIIFLSFGLLICACSSTETTTLKILTHDSFDAKQELIDEFTKTHNINVQIIKLFLFLEINCVKPSTIISDDLNISLGLYSWEKFFSSLDLSSITIPLSGELSLI